MSSSNDNLRIFAPGRKRPQADYHAVEAAARQIVAVWNETVGTLGAAGVRLINDHRWREIEAALEIFTPETICKVIRFYAGQDWNRKRGAWKTFDHFIAVENITGLTEQMASQAERREAQDSRPPSDPRVAKLSADLAAAQARRGRDVARKQAFDAQDEAKRTAYLERANAELLLRMPGHRIREATIVARAIELFEADCRPKAEGYSNSNEGAAP